MFAPRLICFAHCNILCRGSLPCVHVSSTSNCMQMAECSCVNLSGFCLNRALAKARVQRMEKLEREQARLRLSGRQSLRLGCCRPHTSASTSACSFSAECFPPSGKSQCSTCLQPHRCPCQVQMMANIASRSINGNLCIRSMPQLAGVMQPR